MTNLLSSRRGTGSERSGSVRTVRALAAVAALAVLGASAPVASAGVYAARPGRSHAATPAPVVIILDASGSMNTSDAPGPRIVAAKDAVVSLVRTLPEDARVGMLTYGTRTSSSPADKAAGCRDITVVSRLGRVHKPALINAVRAIHASGYTPIGAALRMAAHALPAGKAGSIVLVSDGEDTCAPPDPCTVARQLKSADDSLIVHTIGFRVRADARRQLRCIANATGGTYRDAVTGAGLGPVLQTQVDAGMRPYVVTGTPIDGTSTPTGAPAIASGQYADRFARSTSSVTKYYSIRLTAPETLYVATTVVPPALRGGGTGTRLEVSAELRNTDDDRCLSSQHEHDSVLAGKVDPVTVVLSGVVGGSSWSKRCARSGTFVLALTRDSSSTTVTSSEIVVRFEPPVRIAPPAVQTVPPGLPSPPAKSPRRSCVGGASFDTAPLLTNGACRDSLSTGETRYYRVHLAWGQRLAYTIVVQRVAGASHGVGEVRSAVATPMRQDLTLASTSNAARDFGGPAAIALTGSTLVPVAYGNRGSARSDVRSYSLAGDYYLSLGLSFPIGAVPYRTGVVIAVRIAGQARGGPDYLRLPRSADSTTPPSSTPPASSTLPTTQPPSATATTSVPPASDRSGSGDVAGWIAGSIGAAALLIAGSTWVWSRRPGTRRR